MDEIVVQVESTPILLTVNVVDPEPPIVVTLAEVGLAGPAGPPGPAGGAVFAHHQTNPGSTWTVTHNLGRYAVPVLLLDDEPDRPVVADYDTPSQNLTVITLPAPATGWAYF